MNPHVPSTPPEPITEQVELMKGIMARNAGTTPASGSLKGLRGVGTPTPPAHKSRTSIVGQVSYQREGFNKATVLSTRSVRLHADTLPPDEIEVLLTEKWIPLDIGRVKNPGLIVISNNSSPPAPKLPEASKPFEWPDNTIEIALDLNAPAGKRDSYSPSLQEPLAHELVPPGEDQRITPPDAETCKRYRLRARKGTVQAVITVFPA